MLASAPSTPICEDRCAAVQPRLRTFAPARGSAVHTTHIAASGVAAGTAQHRSGHLQRRRGAIAIGHPYGMSGARMVGHALIERPAPWRSACRGHNVHRRRHGRSGIIRGRLSGQPTRSKSGEDPLCPSSSIRPFRSLPRFSLATIRPASATATSSRPPISLPKQAELIPTR